MEMAYCGTPQAALGAHLAPAATDQGWVQAARLAQLPFGESLGRGRAARRGRGAGEDAMQQALRGHLRRAGSEGHLLLFSLLDRWTL